MPTNARRSEQDRDHEYDLAVLRSHELHMRHIYGLRWAALAISALTIIIGAVMIFAGLQGSFNWAVEAPNSVGAKLTNASPGIVFATVGLVLGFIVVIQKPVNYSVGGPRDTRGGVLLGESLRQENDPPGLMARPRRNPKEQESDPPSLMARPRRNPKEQESDPPSLVAHPRRSPREVSITMQRIPKSPSDE